MRLLLKLLVVFIYGVLCNPMYAAQEQAFQLSFTASIERADKKTRFVNCNLFIRNNKPCLGKFVMFGHNNGANIPSVERDIKDADLPQIHNVLLLHSAGLKDNKVAMEELAGIGYPTFQELQWERL